MGSGRRGRAGDHPEGDAAQHDQYGSAEEVGFEYRGADTNANSNPDTAANSDDDAHTATHANGNTASTIQSDGSAYRSPLEER